MSIKKNTIVSSNRFSTNGLLEDMEVKYFEGAEWAKIFEHNNKSGTVLFTSVDECLKSLTDDKYSRLYLLDNFKNINNKYEFLLQYPDYDNTKYNRWMQNNNPCNEYVTPVTGGSPAEGYEGVHIDWSNNYFGGMARNAESTTSITNTYLSGSVGHTNYWYAIGAKNGYGGGIPGPGVAITGKVQMWVRIDNLPEEKKCQIQKNCIIANDFYEE